MVSAYRHVLLLADTWDSPWSVHTDMFCCLPTHGTAHGQCIQTCSAACRHMGQPMVSAYRHVLLLADTWDSPWSVHTDMFCCLPTHGTAHGQCIQTCSAACRHMGQPMVSAYRHVLLLADTWDSPWSVHTDMFCCLPTHGTAHGQCIQTCSAACRHMGQPMVSAYRHVLLLAFQLNTHMHLLHSHNLRIPGF